MPAVQSYLNGAFSPLQSCASMAKTVRRVLFHANHATVPTIPAHATRRVKLPI